MQLGELGPANVRIKRKRLGRGIGSGLGKTSGKGHKGQKARSGGGVRRGFEGGQTPLYRRLPKRGFKNIHAKNYTEVTLTMLNKSEATEVTAESLLAEGIIGKINDGIVVLATGKLDKKLTVKAKRFTKAAAEKMRQDSIQAVMDKMTADSLAAVQAVVEQARIDSMAAVAVADSIAKVEAGKKTATKPKPKPKPVEPVKTETPKVGSKRPGSK